VAKKKTATSREPSFEESLQTLETIVAKLEGGKLGLDASLEQYEQGVKHLKSCYRLLGAAERRIELVSGVDAAGNPRSESFSDGETDDVDSETLEKKSASRSRRRTAPAKGAASRSKSGSEVDDASSLF